MLVCAVPVAQDTAGPFGENNCGLCLRCGAAGQAVTWLS